MSFQLHTVFDDFAGLRRANLNLIDTIPPDKLDTVPDGFNNSVRWQAGHIVTVQVSLLYRRTGQPLPIPDNYFGYFGKGTAPRDFDQATPSFEEIRRQLERMIAVTAADLDRLATAAYSEPVKVSTGKALNSFADGLLFLLVHEAYHWGNLTDLKRFL